MAIIGIIGAGKIGGALGKQWGAHGHEIWYGTRNPNDEKFQTLVNASGGNAHVSTLQEAAAQSDVIALAVPASAVQETLKGLGDLTGKILIDCTNDLSNPTKADAQMIAAWIPGAKVFKAFNTAGFEVFTETMFGELQADMFFCGDDAAARVVVERLIADVGFRPVYVGDLSTAPLVESLAKLWIRLSRAPGHSRRMAFKLLTEELDIHDQ